MQLERIVVDLALAYHKCKARRTHTNDEVIWKKPWLTLNDISNPHNRMLKQNNNIVEHASKEDDNLSEGSYISMYCIPALI